MPTQRLNFIFRKSFIPSSLILLFFIWENPFYQVNWLSGPSHSGLPTWNGSPFVLKNRIWFLVYYFQASSFHFLFFIFNTPNQLNPPKEFFTILMNFHHFPSRFKWVFLKKSQFLPYQLLLPNPFSSYHFHGFHLFTRGFKIYFLWWQMWQEIQTKELE